MSLRFQVLGPVEVYRGGELLTAGAAQQRAVLALMLARPGQLVTVDDLIDLLWGEQPPHSAVNLIHRYVGAIRRVLEPDLAARSGGRWLVRRGTAYRMAVDAASLDLLHFRELAAEGRRLAQESAGNPTAALAPLLEALSLWRGRCAEDVDVAGLASHTFSAVDEEYVAALVDAADLALAAGRAGDLLPLLRRAAARDRMNERVQARWMRALAATGQQAAALESYQLVRGQLADELGVDPGPELKRAHQDLLLARTAPTMAPLGAEPAAEDRPAGHDEPAPIVVPAQLPADLPAFAGRQGELARITQWIEEHAHRSSAPLVIAIDGMAGIGKTTLAVHLAHQVAGRYPDGQLFVNLRGYDPGGATTAPSDALRLLLQALGAPGRRIPDSLDAQVGMYRSILARKRVLVLLDNARDFAQVCPLMPAGTGSLVIATSRASLTGLAASAGARLLTLGLPTLDSTRQIAAERLGRARVEAEREVVDEIIHRCGRLPLALAIVAAHATAHPDFPLAAIARALREARNSLDAFDAAGGFAVDIRAVFSWSYDLLSLAAARMFRLLALAPGSDITAATCASLAAVPVRDAHHLLTELSAAALITESSPGRYTMHDLLRAYSAEQCEQVEPAAEATEARARIVEHYLHSAYAADQTIYAYRPQISPAAARPFVRAQVFPDAQAALAWFAEEHAVLGKTVAMAAEHGMHRQAWLLALSLQQQLHQRGAYHEWLQVMRTALTATRRAADREGEAHVRRSLAGAYFYLGRYDECRSALDEAMTLYEGLGLTAYQAYVHTNYGYLLEKTGQPARALECHERARDLCRSIGNESGEMHAVSDASVALTMLGDFDQAIVLGEQALAFRRKHCDRHAETLHILRNLGTTYGKAGEYERALGTLSEALDMARELRHLPMEATVLIALGDVSHAAGRTADAASAWTKARVLYERMNVAGLPGAEEATERLERLVESSESPDGRTPVDRDGAGPPTADRGPRTSRERAG